MIWRSSIQSALLFYANIIIQTGARYTNIEILRQPNENIQYLFKAS